MIIIRSTQDTLIRPMREVHQQDARDTKRTTIHMTVNNTIRIGAAHPDLKSHRQQVGQAATGHHEKGGTA